MDKDGLTKLRHELGSGYMEEERQAGKQMCAILKVRVGGQRREREMRLRSCELSPTLSLELELDST